MHPGQVSEWRKLPLSLAELCIETTLRCGQSFRWRKINDEWNCVLYGRLLSLKQDKNHLQYRVVPSMNALTPPASVHIKSESTPHEDDTGALVKHYFSLKHDLSTLYEQWSKSDANFREKAPEFTGIRILSQDPWEALVAFICSSNNNISRISQMVHKLCIHYGPFVGRIGDEAFHDFPTPQALSGSKVEAHLRELGFGYRAKYIAETARLVTEDKPTGWLQSLINPDNPGWASTEISTSSDPPTYRQAHEQLLLLSGVGPKVADCVCLMGLGWGEAVPVDTHVWQIAQRDYKFGKVKTKTFSKVMYDSVGDHFRKMWGQQAGWAQSVLFTANLKSFSDQASGKLEPVDIKVEVKEVEKDVIADEAIPVPRTRKRRRTTVVETLKVEEPVSTEIARATRRQRKART
ncbi:8-oxoguanine DNA-glycosylase [Hypoxylon sp. FL1284]|nr:8-oxoguanine DNA-glycosylase [Hypoxylon sp. FL1284]